MEPATSPALRRNEARKRLEFQGLVNCGISERGLNVGKGERVPISVLFDPAPICGFRVYKNDVVIVRKATNPEELTSRLVGAKRGVIEDLSGSSRRNLAFVAANTEKTLSSFITLTYPTDFPCDGKKVKRHLHAFLAALRRRFGRTDYLWFLEFQKRGAPHFHLFSSIQLPGPLVVLRRQLRSRDAEVNPEMQEWVSEAWFRIVGSKDDRHLRAGSCWEALRKADGAARYVAKEAYKTFQKVVPDRYHNVGRFWGTSKGFRPEEAPLRRSGARDLRRLFGDRIVGPAGRIFPIIWNGSDHLRTSVNQRKSSI